MTEPTRDTVLLDVDGTLADTTYHHTLAWSRAFAQHALAPPLWQIHHCIGMGGDKLVPMLAGEGVERDLGDTLREQWAQEYERLLPETHLLQGARDLVMALHERGLKVALVSSGKEAFTEHVLDLLDLPEGVLGTVTTSDDAQESKPQPDILQVALDRVAGAGALVVGDTPYDVASAARMGAPCVVVRSGGFGVQELESSGAVLVVDGPEDLIDADWEDLLRREPPPGAEDPEPPMPH